MTLNFNPISDETVLLLIEYILAFKLDIKYGSWWDPYEFKFFHPFKHVCPIVKFPSSLADQQLAS
jgi:hypothetical protein